jgi:ADP-ribosylglycohydrolase
MQSEMRGSEEMKISKISYTENPLPELRLESDDLTRFTRLAAEFGHGDEARKVLGEVFSQIRDANHRLALLVETPEDDPDEPETLEAIRRLRPAGVRRLVDALPQDYATRWTGSILGRSAGCTLGAALEFSSMEQMKNWAEYFGEEFPPRDYFQRIKEPGKHRYIVGKIDDVTRGKMSFVPADDDTAYTLIGLMTMEQFGEGFTPQQQADLWHRNFTLTSPENGSYGAYWGERQFLVNLDRGFRPPNAGYRTNPNVQSIAAWTRADPWGYVAPGWPEKAAELAFKDSSINHRRNGVYGSMFFAAAISAAFVVDDPIEAIKIGLQEIPANCLLAEAINWALDIGDSVKNYHDAGTLVRERYANMFEGHAVNNALFVVFGILIAGKDFTRLIGETISMGFDNDCTGATAGSIVGAIIGEKNIPNHWTDCFDGRMQSYLRDLPPYVTFDELGQRFEVQARKLIG